MNATASKEGIGKALGRIASGVYIVTTGGATEADGMLATWIGQAAFEPPMVNVAVKLERPILAKLAPGAKFVINVLGKKNMDIFKVFAKPAAEGVDRFASLNVHHTENGPVFSDAIGFLACKVVAQTPAGDHVSIVAEVVDGGNVKTDDEPMVHLRSNGFQY